MQRGKRHLLFTSAFIAFHCKHDFMKNILILSSIALSSLVLTSCGLVSLATLPVKVAADVVEGSYNTVKAVGSMALPSNDAAE